MCVWPLFQGERRLLNWSSSGCVRIVLSFLLYPLPFFPISYIPLPLFSHVACLATVALHCVACSCSSSSQPIIPASFSRLSKSSFLSSVVVVVVLLFPIFLVPSIPHSCWRRINMYRDNTLHTHTHSQKYDGGGLDISLYRSFIHLRHLLKNSSSIRHIHGSTNGRTDERTNVIHLVATVSISRLLSPPTAQNSTPPPKERRKKNE